VCAGMLSNVSVAKSPYSLVLCIRYVLSSYTIPFGPVSTLLPDVAAAATAGSVVALSIPYEYVLGRCAISTLSFVLSIARSSPPSRSRSPCVESFPTRHRSRTVVCRQVGSCVGVQFEPTIPAGERSETYTLDRAATGTGINDFVSVKELRYAVPCP